jgi:hypothetical protein
MAAQLLQDPSSWVSALGGGAQKKVGFNVLDWVNKATGGQTPVPGAAKQETSPTDFMSYLKNGVQLCKLANFLQPGAIHDVNEQATTKESQFGNVGKFLNFAKNMAGVGGGSLFKGEDLVNGKTSAFPQVLSTLLSLGTNAQQNFGKNGLDVNTLIQFATSGAGRGILSSLCGSCSGRNAHE